MLVCANCEKTYSGQNKLDLIDDIYMRVEPGETMPHGQCPDCGALVHESEEEN